MGSTPNNKMNLGDINRPSSRVARPPGGTSSNIFGSPVVTIQAQPADAEVASSGRFDPITGKMIPAKKVEPVAVVAEEEVQKEDKSSEEEKPTEEVAVVSDEAKAHEPHLGPVKKFVWHEVFPAPRWK